MINVCSLDVLWVSLLFFFSFEPSAPNYSLPYNFYDGKICFSSCRERGTKKTLFFHEDSGFFSLSHSQNKTKKVFCFSFTDLKNYNDIFLIQFYNKGSENLVLDQPTMTLSTYFFIPITCFLDIVRRNSVLVIHIS